MKPGVFDTISLDPEKFVLFTREVEYSPMDMKTFSFRPEREFFVTFSPIRTGFWWVRAYSLYSPSSGERLFGKYTFRKSPETFDTREELVLYAESVGKRPLFVDSFPSPHPF